MKIIEITSANKDAYDHFVVAHPLGSIHQIWDWGIFQTKSLLRDKFWVFAVVADHPKKNLADNEGESGDSNLKILASALVMRQRLPFGKCWLYCPRGPIGDYFNESGLLALKKIFEKISWLAQKENAIFLRFDPPLKDTNAPNLRAFFLELLARLAHAQYQPESTLILNLKQEPRELLQKMKPKGRYNIKVAQKHGVTVRVSSLTGGPKVADDLKSASDDKAVGADAAFTSSNSGMADLRGFYDLLCQTTARDGFSGHPFSYYKNMLEVLGPDRAKLYLAEYKGKLLAGMIATYFGKTATYYFGASANEHRNTMAPYLLHWQAINDARAAGFEYYDFFGISPATSVGGVDIRSDIRSHCDTKLAAPQHRMLTDCCDTKLAAPQHRMLTDWPLHSQAPHSQALAFDNVSAVSATSDVGKLTPPQHRMLTRPHPWDKVTAFKLKFGGERVNYIAAQEIIYKPFWYRLIRLIKAGRMILRGKSFLRDRLHFFIKANEANKSDACHGQEQAGAGGKQEQGQAGAGASRDK